MRFLRVLLSGALVLTAIPSGHAPAAADPVPGDAYNLTVGVLMSEQALVGEALNKPAVQVALEYCEGRGYVRIPEYDRAGQTISTHGASGSYVILAFSKPGVPISSDTLIAPIVVVSSWRSFATEPVRSIVEGGLVTVIRQPANEQVVVYNAEGSPNPKYLTSDPTFAVPSAAGAPALVWCPGDPSMQGNDHVTGRWEYTACVVGSLALLAMGIALTCPASCPPLVGCALTPGCAVPAIGIIGIAVIDRCVSNATQGASKMEPRVRDAAPQPCG